jgi:Spy/CpxP family protein refolding chaperone
MRMIPLAAFALSLAFAAEMGAQGGPAQQNRPVLEQRLRERMAAIIRQRLQLDDAQMSKLHAVNARFAPQMAALVTQERQTRQQLRTQLMNASADQNQVAGLLDTILRLQKQRIALLESEQKDLSAFLTPVQRAKYMALQAQIRRRAEQLRGGGAPPPRRRAGSPPPR